MEKNGYVIKGMPKSMVNEHIDLLREDIELFLNQNNEAIPVIRLTRREALKMRWEMWKYRLFGKGETSLRKI